jgi:hypothetical protein
MGLSGASDSIGSMSIFAGDVFVFGFGIGVVQQTLLVFEYGISHQPRNKQVEHFRWTSRQI